MYELKLSVNSKEGARDLVFPVRRMINAGFVGRDQVAVKQHIEELKAEGISCPDEVPTYYPVASYLLRTVGPVEVVEQKTSGEAEFVILLREGKVYIGAGSDHTDRNLEADSIIKAKQMCPNVMSSAVWPYEEVRSCWDELELRSWVVSGGKRILYQETKLAEILNVEDLIALVREKVTDGDMEDMVIFSGTVAVLGGEMIPGEEFEVGLLNPVTGESLRCAYQIKLLDYLK